MDTNQASLNAVCDTGPLIHLDELGCLDLLNDFQEILIGPTVRNELQRNRQDTFSRIKLKVTEGLSKTYANPIYFDLFDLILSQFSHTLCFNNERGGLAFRPTQIPLASFLKPFTSS